MCQKGRTPDGSGLVSFHFCHHVTIAIATAVAIPVAVAVAVSLLHCRRRWRRSRRRCRHPRQDHRRRRRHCRRKRRRHGYLRRRRRPLPALVISLLRWRAVAASLCASTTSLPPSLPPLPTTSPCRTRLYHCATVNSITSAILPTTAVGVVSTIAFAVVPTIDAIAVNLCYWHGLLSIDLSFPLPLRQSGIPSLAHHHPLLDAVVLTTRNASIPPTANPFLLHHQHNEWRNRITQRNGKPVDGF